MKFLSEKEIIYLTSKPVLPFLFEYLILSDGITIEESILILNEAKTKYGELLEKIKESYKNKVKALNRMKKKEMAKAVGDIEKAAIIDKYKPYKIKLAAAFKTSVETLRASFKNVKTGVKKSIYKDGKFGKGLTKKGKVGLASIPVAAAGASYAAYRAEKNRTAALRMKKR